MSVTEQIGVDDATSQRADGVQDIDAESDELAALWMVRLYHRMN
jgi:hypothetical protein